MAELNTGFYGVLAVISIGALLLGYLLASVRLKQQLSAVITESGERQQQLTSCQLQLVQLQQQYQLEQEKLQQLRLVEIKLSEQQRYSDATSQRLQQQLTQTLEELKQAQLEYHNLTNRYTRLKTELDERDA
ncbi:MAG: hypothetical protein B7Z18_09030, partial [Alishewanella sp. 32-51-5]